MAMITKALIGTLAPILTYTMDELLEYAPNFIKGDCEDIFDFKKYVIPNIESNINETILALSTGKLEKSDTEGVYMKDPNEFEYYDEK